MVAEMSGDEGRAQAQKTPAALEATTTNVRSVLIEAAFSRS
jgi:hypothetical protein